MKKSTIVLVRNALTSLALNLKFAEMQKHIEYSSKNFILLFIQRYAIMCYSPTNLHSVALVVRKIYSRITEAI